MIIRDRNGRFTIAVSAQVGSMHSLNTTNSSTPTVTRTRYSTAQEIVKKR